MDKPRYEKPIVFDLNGNSANGGPLSCVAGPSAGGTDETCAGGNGATYYCGNGSADNGNATPCFGGSSVQTGDCTFGSSPNSGFCEGGSSGINYNGCRTGPSA